MPAANQAFTEELTDTYTYEAYPLGTLRYESAGEVNRKDATHLGERTWVFVHNDEGGSLVVGDIIEMGNDAGNGTSGFSPYRAVQSNTAAAIQYRILGVAAHTIADGAYGWIVAQGMCEVKGSSATITAGEAIVSNTAGQAKDLAGGEEASVIGMAHDADAGANVLFTCYISTL